MNYFFYSSISFIISIFFILLGVVGVLLPWSSDMRTRITQLLLEESWLVFLFGLGFIIIGTAIVTNLILSTKRRYYEIRSNHLVTKIDESLFQDYLSTYWKQLFPACEIPNQIILKNNKIHVAADLPYIPLEQQKTLLERIERDLNDIFNRILGMRYEYVISISFQSEPDKKS